jgi:hypothetical protein
MEDLIKEARAEIRKIEDECVFYQDHNFEEEKRIAMIKMRAMFKIYDHFRDGIERNSPKEN